MRCAVLAAVLVAAALGCQPDGVIPLARCPDDGTCFDAPDAEAPPRPPPWPGQRDAWVDPRPDAMLDAMPVTDGAMLDAMSVIDGGITDAIPDAIADAMPDVAPDIGPPSTCAELGRTECFGHPDCAAADRCENLGSDAQPLPCCVPGPRGELPAGASCAEVDGQIACASGVCIESDSASLCSAPCLTPADCPPTLPRCVPFPFGGTAFDWCFPE